MPVYTQQILLKLTDDDIDIIDKAYKVNNENNTEKYATRTDYIRHIIREMCGADYSKFILPVNLYVKDDILNKIIWTIMSNYHLSTLELPDGKPFRALYLDDFAFSFREYIEDIFRDLKNKSCLDYEKNHKGRLVAYDFNIPLLLDAARANIVLETMEEFITEMKKWNTPSAVPFCHSHVFRNDTTKVKKDLSNNGFIIIKESKTHIPNDWFVREIINDGPTEYARQLWDIPFYKVGEKKSNLYVTFPDIYIGQK